MGLHKNFNTVSRYELDAETSSAPLIPDKLPTLANAQIITEGMSPATVYALLGTEAWDTSKSYSPPQKSPM